ncbi:DUF2442 domain-containing protein [candidate division KSB1 bacterium]|nr:MAG: DUF2442 domain-containing protein [candidate division KSB1 bacterium]
MPDVKKIRFSDNLMQLVVDGKIVEIDLAMVSNRLLNASDVERDTYIVSPSGYGIHWPIIDEDLSIDGLIGIKHDSHKVAVSQA